MYKGRVTARVCRFEAGLTAQVPAPDRKYGIRDIVGLY